MDTLGATGASAALGLAGLAVAVLGIIIGVAYARRKPHLVFFQEGRVVVVARPQDDLDVHWRHKSVPAFARTRIWIWNAGSVTLDRPAIVPGYPPRLSWGDEATEVLAVERIACTKDENGAVVEKDPVNHNAVTISTTPSSERTIWIRTLDGWRRAARRG